MNKKSVIIGILIIASFSTIVLKANINPSSPAMAGTESVMDDFVMPDPAEYINTTYNGEVLNTEDELPDVDLGTTVTIWYVLFQTEWSNNTNDFLRLKGNDGGKTLDINQNTGPFFTFVSENGTHSFYKFDFTVSFDGKTQFYAIYNVFTPCGMYLASEETIKHYIVTTGAETTTTTTTEEESTPVSESSSGSSPGFELVAGLGSLVITTLFIQRKRK